MPSAARDHLSILHLTAGSDAGGVSRYLFDLCTAMRARGHTCAIAGERGAWHELFQDSGIEWIELPMKGGPLALRRCARALRARPFDVAHAHFRKSALVSRKLGRPLLFTLHLTGIPLSPLHRWLTDFGDHTHVPSQQAKQWLIDAARLPGDRITVIPHGIDPVRFPMATDIERQAARRQLDIAPSALVAAFVGRYDEPKNETWLVDIARAIPESTILMQGEGPREGELRRAIADARVSNIRLLPYGDPLPVYRACDVLLLPSGQEGFSLVCAEAMSVGRPVLRTATAGTAETIVEGVTGWSSPIDRAVFVEKATVFLKDEPALRRMGAAAAAHVRANLAFDHQVEQTVALYRQLADNNGV